MGNIQPIDNENEIPLEGTLENIIQTRKSILEGTTSNSSSSSTSPSSSSSSSLGNEINYSTLEDGSSIQRRRTETENVIVNRKDVVKDILSK